MNKIPLKQLDLGAPTSSTPGVIKTGHTETINEHPLCVDSNGKGFIKENIFWGNVSTYTNPNNNKVVPQITISTSSNPDLPETPPSIITVLITQFVNAPIYATDEPKVGKGRLVWNNTPHGLRGLEMQDIVMPVPNESSNGLLLTIYTGETNYRVLNKFVSPKAKQIYIDPDTNTSNVNPYRRLLLEPEPTSSSIIDLVPNNALPVIGTPVASRYVGVSKDGNLLANSISTNGINVATTIPGILLGQGGIGKIHMDENYFTNIDNIRNHADSRIETATYNYPYNIPLIKNTNNHYKNVLLYNTSHNDCFIKTIDKNYNNILGIEYVLSPTDSVLPSIDGMILNHKSFSETVNIYQDDYNMFSEYLDRNSGEYRQDWYEQYYHTFNCNIITDVITRTGTMYIFCTDSTQDLTLRFDVDNIIYRISPCQQFPTVNCGEIDKSDNKLFHVLHDAVEYAPVIVRLTWDYMTANKSIVVDTFQGSSDFTPISQPKYDTRKL